MFQLDSIALDSFLQARVCLIQHSFSHFLSCLHWFSSAPSWHSWFDAFLGLPFSSLFPLSASFTLGSSVHSHDFTYPHYNLHPTISSSVIPFSSCLQSFPVSGSFLKRWLFTSGGLSIGAPASASVLPMNIQDWFPLGLIESPCSPRDSKVFSSTTIHKYQFFALGGQRIGASTSALVLPMNIQDWFTLGLTGLISLQSKGLSRVFSNTTVQKHQFFGTQLSL